MAKKWQYGRPTFNPLYEDGEFEGLAEYIVKKETKEEQEGCSYSRAGIWLYRSQREIIHRKMWRSEPKAPKGWYVDKNSLINGENPVTGYPYQHYTIKKLDPGGGNS